MSQHELDDDVSADLSSQFLKQSDFDDGPQVLIIQRVEKKTFEAQAGRPAEAKWVVTFVGGKCLGLNRTNLQLLAKWFGKKTGAWIGKAIVIYVDESVTFGGRLTGGLRVRKPTRQDKKLSRSDAPAGDAVDAADDVPF